MSSVGDISTVVEEDPAPDLAPAEVGEVPRPPDRETFSKMARFAFDEIGRLNSVLGASISDLELGLNMLPEEYGETSAARTREVISEALDGCQTIAQFQRILARLDSMRSASRYEHSIPGCLDESCARLKEDPSVRGISLVRNYSSPDEAMSADRQRMTQATTWLVMALGAGIHASTSSARQRIISIGYEEEEGVARLVLGQTVAPFEELEASISRNHRAHWYVEAARIALGWEGFALRNLESREFAGYVVERSEFQRGTRFEEYLSGF